VVARALGQIWSNLSDAEKLPYRQKAAKERERVQLQVEAWKAAGGVVGEPQSGNTINNNNTDTPGTTTFPVARIRKICKLDPEVKNLSKEALLLVTKAAELALAKLGKECVKTAQIQNRRKLLPDDVAQVCAVREQFAFLRDDIVDLHRQQLHETAEKAKVEKPTTKKDGAAAASMKNSKPLTDYFKTAAN
jgi:histone H3/H4